MRWMTRKWQMKTDDPLKKFPLPLSISPEDGRGARSSLDEWRSRTPHDGTTKPTNRPTTGGQKIRYHPVPGKEQYSLEKLAKRKQAFFRVKMWNGEDMKVSPRYSMKVLYLRLPQLDIDDRTSGGLDAEEDIECLGSEGTRP